MGAFSPAPGIFCAPQTRPDARPSSNVRSLLAATMLIIPRDSFVIPAPPFVIRLIPGPSRNPSPFRAIVRPGIRVPASQLSFSPASASRPSC